MSDKTSGIYPSISQRVKKGIGCAIGDYDLISTNDRIMVGLSGGKDSALLLLALTEILKKSPVKFELEACTVDMTNGKMDTSCIEAFCNSLGVPYHVKCHPIEEIINIRDERSPCSLCSNFRRGIICSMAVERNCDSIALGHNLDDVSETALMNLFHTGRYRCFKPKLWQSRSKIWVIRPMVYIEERLIQNETERLGIPIAKNPCPYSGKTERNRTKDLISTLSDQIPDIRKKIIKSFTNIDTEDRWVKNN